MGRAWHVASLPMGVALQGQNEFYEVVELSGLRRDVAPYLCSALNGPRNLAAHPTIPDLVSPTNAAQFDHFR
jgi:hypothetical protein